MNPELVKATRRQQQAAIPTQSVYVSANAGSGKTRVLVNRVSRLLLRGSKPDKILCLTYTKAAASEMQTRLYHTLGQWSVMDDAKLQAKLTELDGDIRPRNIEQLRNARRLFARALETPEGLKVQTIHAFCERILRRFPIEAGIAPGYDAMDDGDREAILSEVKEQLFTQALAEPNGNLARSINRLAAESADAFLEGLISWAAGANYDMAAWETSGLSSLAHRLGVTEDITESMARQQAWFAAPKAEIKSAADEMAQSGVSNQKAAALIHEALIADTDEAAFAIYKNVFLTGAGGARKSISYSAIADHLFGTEKKGYGAEAERMFAAIDRVKAAKTLELTRCVFCLALPAAKAYRAGKRARRLMDFTDQIMLARDLLTRSAAREWVRYKLDGGVDHILVDEAQDTAPQQWDIIDAVGAEFNAVENSQRTRFAVGDEKQSIYSFQGARPELFLERLQVEITEDAHTKIIPLTMSFRSAPQVLDMVDAVFADCDAISDMFATPPTGDLPRHVAHRDDDGRVELWPLAPAPEKAEPERAWSFDPVDKMAAQSSRERLAVQIAAQIKTWLDSGEAVYDRDLKHSRAMQAKDIMILVQKRSPFFNAVIRNLKLAGVAVAGADRLKLTDNIGVQDLISLGKFISLPADDLSLAEVLKSPIFGLNDEALFALAFPRKGTLWDELNMRDLTAHPEFYEARSVLRKILKFAPIHAPYELYARILATLMPVQAGQERISILKRLFLRLGIEAADPIQAFLARALAHQRSGPPSLVRFLRDLEGDGSELKREMESTQNEVRVMTVHGSKGLEAPVVIMPDTTQKAKVGIRGFEMEAIADNGYVLRQSAGDTPATLSDVSERREALAHQESLRLLYVAMTRAESRLVVCGFESGSKKLDEGSWYDWISRAFTHKGESLETRAHEFGEMRSYGPAKTMDAGSLHKAPETPLPKWGSMEVLAHGAGLRRVTPSHLLAGLDEKAQPPVRSPLANLKHSGLGRFRRGNMIHKLLEILPGTDMSRRRDVAAAYLTAQPDMTARLQAEITDEVFTVLEHPDFAAIFAPGSKAEIALAGTAAGLPEGVFINAQIDRLSVTETEVWIVDYKSNRPPPMQEADVAELYIAQLAAYRALAQDIYPKKTVRCALLWTDGPHLMEITNARLEGFNLRAALTT